MLTPPPPPQPFSLKGRILLRQFPALRFCFESRCAQVRQFIVLLDGIKAPALSGPGGYENAMLRIEAHE